MGIDSISKQRVQQDPDYANMVNADLRTFVYLDGEYLVDKETAKNSVRMMTSIIFFGLAWPLCIALAFVGPWPFVAGVLFLLWTYALKVIFDLNGRVSWITSFLARDVNYLLMHIKQIHDAFPEKQWLDAQDGIVQGYPSVRDGAELL